MPTGCIRSGSALVDRGVADPAVGRDGPGGERVCDVHDVLGLGHLGEDRVDRLLLGSQRLVVVGDSDFSGSPANDSYIQ